jgi:hypothetical protein
LIAYLPPLHAPPLQLQSSRKRRGSLDTGNSRQELDDRWKPHSRQELGGGQELNGKQELDDVCGQKLDGE